MEKMVEIQFFDLIILDIWGVSTYLILVVVVD
jgi:hypothetical protein